MLNSFWERASRNSTAGPPQKTQDLLAMATLRERPNVSKVKSSRKFSMFESFIGYILTEKEAAIKTFLRFFFLEF